VATENEGTGDEAEEEGEEVGHIKQGEGQRGS
jgi:hypothetical protein